MKTAAARFEEEIGDKELADFHPELRAAIVLWLAAGLISRAGVLALAETMRRISREMLAHHDSSLREAVLSSLREAIASGADLAAWSARDWPRISRAFASNGSRTTLLVETAGLLGEAAGQYAYDFSPRRILAEPYWMYLTMADDRVRPKHMALHGKVFRKNDRFAQKYLPPWEPGCRCRARSLSEPDMRSMGVVVGSGSSVPFITTSTGKPIGLPISVFNRSRVDALVPDEFIKSFVASQESRRT